jgi:hypothetical protein
MGKEMSMPYEKGQKFLIEIEAKSDGDFIGSELLSKLFSVNDNKLFKFTSLIVKLDMYKKEINTELIRELNNVMVEKGVISNESFPNGIY